MQPIILLNIVLKGSARIFVCLTVGVSLIVENIKSIFYL